MAQATKEVANMEAENQKAIGQQLDTFLRFQALQDKGTKEGVSFKVTGGLGARTLIGSGTNPGITKNYANLSELSNGSNMLSAAAKRAVDRANKGQGTGAAPGAKPELDDTEGGVPILRGGAPNEGDAGGIILRGLQDTSTKNEILRHDTHREKYDTEVGYSPPAYVYDKDGNAVKPPLDYGPSRNYDTRENVNNSVQGYNNDTVNTYPQTYPQAGDTAVSRGQENYWPTETPTPAPDAGSSPTDNSNIQGWNDIDQGIDYG